MNCEIQYLEYKTYYQKYKEEEEEGKGFYNSRECEIDTQLKSVKYRVAS